MTPHFRKVVWLGLLCPWLVGGRCQAPPETSCENGIDDDEDGFVDCDDPDCSGTAAVYYGYCSGEETDCDDHVDNDYDGDEDCEDSDCDDDPACDPVDSSGGSEGLGGGGGAPSSGGTSSGGSGGSTGGSELGGGAGEGGSGPTVSCPTPIPAEEGASFVNLGDLADFTDFTQSSCQAAGSGADIATYYVPPADGTLTVAVYSTYSDLDVSVRTDCGDPRSEIPTACTATESYGAVDSLSLEVDAEETLFIIVSGATADDEAAAYLSLQLD